MSHRRVRVHFNDVSSSLASFSREVGQLITPGTRSIWWPSRTDVLRPPPIEDEAFFFREEPTQETLFEKGFWWTEMWRGRPEFIQQNRRPALSLTVCFDSDEDVDRFEQKFGRIYQGKWMWYPSQGYRSFKHARYVSDDPPSGPKYPVFVPTKSRHQHLNTIRALDRLGVRHHAVVEPHQADDYEKALSARGVTHCEILVVPHKDKGLVVTRNWIWDYASAMGAERFWTLDDNIGRFYRLNRNAKLKLETPVFLRIIEDFVGRFDNVPIIGMQYEMFVESRVNKPSFALNTRVYSNMLIETHAQDPSGRAYRNEGFYNDDTDLCLRMLKDGRSTVLLYAFLADKMSTMKLDGGMTPHYRDDGGRKMAEELRQKHPDVTTFVYRWGRWQHQVDYSRFKTNDPQFRVAESVADGVDEFGMVLEINGNRHVDLRVIESLL